MPIPVALPPPPPDFGPRHCIVRQDAGTRAGRPSAIDAIASETYPIVVHWDGTFTPEQAELVLESAELAWAVQVEQLGYRAPVLPDTADGPELDLYLSGTEASPWEAWTVNDSNTDDTSGDGLFGVSSYIVLGQVPDTWMPSYVAHEFNHVLQYATDYSEWFINFWESHATAAQKWTLGGPDYANEITSWQKMPFGPSLVGDSYLLWPDYPVAYSFEYGAVVWAVYMDDVYGAGDGTMGPALWYAAANEGWSYEPDHMDAVIALGEEIGPLMDGLAVARYLTGSRWDSRGLAEAQVWTSAQEVPFDTKLALADVPATVAFVDPLMVTGQGYIRIDVGGGSTDELTVSVSDAAQDFHSSLLLMWWNTDGSVSDTLADADVSGAHPSRTLDLSGVDEVVVAVSNLGPPGADYDYVMPTKTGDFLVELALVGGADTGDTGTPDDTGAGEDTGAPAPPAPADADGGGCGCGGGAVGPTLAPLGLVALLRRRRR